MDVQARPSMGNVAVPSSKYRQHVLKVQKQQNALNNELRHVFNTIQECLRLLQIDHHTFTYMQQVMQHKVL